MAGGKGCWALEIIFLSEMKWTLERPVMFPRWSVETLNVGGLTSNHWCWLA